MVQVAGVDIYVNHAVLHLGATDWVPVSLTLEEAAAASCETHVAVRVRAGTHQSTSLHAVSDAE